MEIALLVALILLNGAFAMSEIALVSSRRSRLVRLADRGDPAAEVAIALHDEPTRFLSTVQIGITSIGILNGIVGEAVLAEPLAHELELLGMEPDSSALAATALVVVVITYVSIVIGELVPKRIGQSSPEAIARLVARPMRALAVVTRPFVALLTLSTDSLLRLLGRVDREDQGVTEEEIRAMIEEGSDSGVIERQEHDMVRNVFRLDERQIASLMIPRADITYLDVGQSTAENLQRITESDHSRFPVCRGGLHDVIGVIGAKQLLNQALRGEALDFGTHMEPAVFVPESMTGMDLLEHFRASETHMVFVIDEYGEILGLVTLQDVLEAVTGEFKPRSQEDAWAVQREDGSWLLDGLIPTPDLKDRLELAGVPDEDKNRYHTLGGMLMWVLGRMPRTGDIVTWEDWRFEIVDLDGKRIDKVLASRIAAEGDAPTTGIGAANSPDQR
jgi:putative hemolysin